MSTIHEGDNGSSGIWTFGPNPGRQDRFLTDAPNSINDKKIRQTKLAKLAKLAQRAETRAKKR